MLVCATLKAKGGGGGGGGGGMWMCRPVRDSAVQLCNKYQNLIKNQISVQQWPYTCSIVLKCR